MVHVLDDWEAVKEYASYCTYGCYQVRSVGEEQEIKVLVGRFGYRGTFKKDDPRLAEIVDFCLKNGFVQVVREVSEDGFFG